MACIDACQLINRCQIRVWTRRGCGVRISSCHPAVPDWIRTDGLGDHQRSPIRSAFSALVLSVSHLVFTSVFVKTWRRDGKGQIMHIHLTCPPLKEKSTRPRVAGMMTVGIVTNICIIDTRSMVQCISTVIRSWCKKIELLG